MEDPIGNGLSHDDTELSQYEVRFRVDEQNVNREPDFFDLLTEPSFLLKFITF